MSDKGQITAIFSGSSYPLANNYSQYLEVRRLAEHLWGEAKSITNVFFGSGLTPESPKDAMPDVYREGGELIAPDIYQDGGFIRGELAANNPATKGMFQNYFQHILDKREWSKDDRFTLYINGHGGPNGFDFTDVRFDSASKKSEPALRNNIISTWFDGDILYPERTDLSVDELRGLIRENISEDVPVNFVITTCYAGAFHMLAISEDGEGYPHADGMICGFTSITNDTTSSGCSPYAEYDGYSRRMVEAITGRSVNGEERIGEPETSLLKAHREAMLEDSTKDVPLRTSEAYVLEYYETDRKKRRDDYELDSELGAIVQGSSSGAAAGHLNDVLSMDREERLLLIEKMQKVFSKTYPLYSGPTNGVGLSEYIWHRKEIARMIKDMDARIASLSETKKEKAKYLWARYLFDLAKSPDAVDQQRYEFENIYNMLEGSPMRIFFRLSREDPTLHKYKRYRDYVDSCENVALNWAYALIDRERKSGVRMTFEESDLREIRELKEGISAAKNQKNLLEVIDGQLRRIELQIRTLAMVEWLARHGKEDVLSEITALVKCENAASI